LDPVIGARPPPFGLTNAIKQEGRVMAQMNYSRIKVTVDSVAGKCPLGNRPGKEFIIERTTPAGMCISAFNAINPAIQVLRYGGSFPWEKNPDEAYICCPDHINRTVFKLERTGEVVIQK
jgi:uncharacterized repeat protein (TIGR04076 family)